MLDIAISSFGSSGPVNLQGVISSRLLASGPRLSRQCLPVDPFPHIIIDNFFEAETAKSITRDISALRDRDYRVSFRSLAQRKLQLGNIPGSAAGIYPIYDTLMGPEFTRFIEEVSGYSGLQGDRQFTGAGLHRYRNGGFSEIHLDSNRHPFDVSLHHRVNLLIFLNPGWDSRWGGELVLWSSVNGRPDRPAAIIEPTYNRAVIFNVTARAWHSVNRIKCPREAARNSVAIYFFSRIGVEGDEEPRSVIWHSTRGLTRQALFEVSNRLITKAKPHARYFRWLRPNKFDGVESR